LKSIMFVNGLKFLIINCLQKKTYKFRNELVAKQAL